MEEQQRRREDIDYNQRFIIASPAEQEEEAEPEDQKEAIEQACMETAECKPVKNRFDSCSERVNADPETEETCVEACICIDCIEIS